MEQDKPVRMHSGKCDKTGIMSDTGEIPGGCMLNIVDQCIGDCMNKERIIKESENYFRKNIPKTRMHESYLRHVVGCKKYALQLAEKCGADKFILEVAAYLHDVGADAGETHPAESARLAKEFLLQFDIPKETLDRILFCIANHKMGAKANNIEEQILQDADGLIFLEDTYLFFFEKQKNKYQEQQARKNTATKLKGMLTKIKTDEGKKLAGPLYKKIPVELKEE